MIRLTPATQNDLTKDSAADGFQVKNVDLERFQDRLGYVTTVQVECVAAAVVVALCVRYRSS